MTSWTFSQRTAAVLAVAGLLGVGCSSASSDSGNSALTGDGTNGAAQETTNGVANSGDLGAGTSGGAFIGGTNGSSGSAFAGTGGSAGSAPQLAGAPAPTTTAPTTTPPTNQGDRYEAVGTNPFTVAAHDPQSTFAADVDTASYDIFVRDIGYGHLPQPDSVRLEEYVNYFDYAYPAPPADAPDPFSIHVDAAPSVFNDATLTVRVGIQGELPPPFEKKPANLVFLIDTSGSMQSAEKLPLVKRVLTGALDVLDPTDTISIVTYASGTGVALEPTPAGDRTSIESVINGLSAAGSTNGAGGIQLAYEQASAGFIDGGINHVILCTDGDFNVGASSDQALVDLIEQERDTGITLTALGFGIGNLNDSMMEAVSNAGNGIYSVIADAAHADSYAEDKLLATIEHIAKDMKIQVEFNPAQVYAYRLLGYENRAIADDQFRDDTVDAGEIGQGHQVTALYEVVPVGGAIPDIAGAPPVVDGDAFSGTLEVSEDDLVLVKVRYKEPGATVDDPASEVTATLAPSKVLVDYAEASADMQWALGIAAFAEILKGSPYAEPTKLDSIGTIFESNAGTDPDRVELLGLFDKAVALLP